MWCDEARFTELYRQCRPPVLAYAWRRVGQDAASDVVDETFFIAWRRRDALPPSPLPWLLVTARNVISQRIRAQARDQGLRVELERAREVMHQTGADAAAVERVAVLAALHELPPADREALMLTVWDGLSPGAASTVVGCSKAAFAVRLHRARRRLAAALARQDADAQDRGARRFAPVAHGESSGPGVFDRRHAPVVQ